MSRHVAALESQTDFATAVLPRVYPNQGDKLQCDMHLSSPVSVSEGRPDHRVRELRMQGLLIIRLGLGKAISRFYDMQRDLKKQATLLIMPHYSRLDIGMLATKVKIGAIILLQDSVGYLSLPALPLLPLHPVPTHQVISRFRRL